MECNDGIKGFILSDYFADRRGKGDFQMKRKFPGTFCRVLLIVVLLNTFYGVSFAKVMAQVQVITVKRGTIARYVSGYGQILSLPDRTVALNSIDSSRILKVNVLPGDSVRKGQVLVELKEGPQVAFDLAKSKIELSRAGREAGMYKRLFHEGVAAGSRMQQAEDALSIAGAQMKLSERQSLTSRESHILRAPLNGRITDVKAVVGQVSNPSVALMTIADLHTVQAVLGVETEDVGILKNGLLVNINVPNVFPKRIFVGKVSWIGKSIDPSTQTIKTGVTVANKRLLLQPGMYTEGKIQVDVHENVLIVPRQAVLPSNGKRMAFIVRNNVAVKQWVETGFSNNREVEIKKGLKDGDMVVVVGNHELEDGMPVKIFKRRLP